MAGRSIGAVLAVVVGLTSSALGVGVGVAVGVAVGGTPVGAAEAGGAGASASAAAVQTEASVVVTPANGLTDGQVVELSGEGLSPTYAGAPIGPFATGGWVTAQCSADLGASPTLGEAFAHCAANAALTGVTITGSALPPTPLPVDATIEHVLGGTTDCAATSGACVLGLLRFEQDATVTIHTAPLTFGAGPPPPTEYVGPVAGFYTAPHPVPAHPPGTLLRYQRLTDLNVAGATAYRIMYVSRSLQDEPIVVTGTSLVPPGAAPAGGRRLLGVAHGMTGIADQCAPSKFPGVTEIVFTGQFVQAGYLVSMTDFEGLGTPGRHPFVVGESEGRSTLDAIRAARQLPDAHGGDQLALAGYSQGGHGSLFAGQLAATWAPELHHVATFAGGPGTELDVIAAVVPGLPNLAGVFYLGVAGLNAAYPEAELSLILTPEGIENLDIVDQGCAGEVYAHYAGLDPADLLQPGYTEAEPWLTLLRRNNPGQVATGAPIFVFHSSQDELIPYQLSEIMMNRMCSHGQVVERVTPAAGSHGGATPAAYRAAFDWIQARFAGQPVTSSCPAP
jgi:hypothetical protein